MQQEWVAQRQYFPLYYFKAEHGGVGLHPITWEAEAMFKGCLSYKPQRQTQTKTVYHCSLSVMKQVTQNRPKINQKELKWWNLDFHSIQTLSFSAMIISSMNNSQASSNSTLIQVTTFSQSEFAFGGNGDTCAALFSAAGRLCTVASMESVGFLNCRLLDRIAAILLSTSGWGRHTYCVPL